MNTFTLHNPEMLSVLLLIPFMIFWYRKREQQERSAKILFPTLSAVTSGGSYNDPRFILFILRLSASLLIVFALARPVRLKQTLESLPEKQVSIVLAIDVSKSMLAEDLKPNRLMALKKIATSFIDRRPKDLIGLTIYAGDSYTQCPLTNDHLLLKSLLADATDEWLADGTAIGMGLASAINRFKGNNTEGKVIILLTDGENNAGTIDPNKAADIALKQNIKVYTIGIGTEGVAPFPVQGIDGEKRYQNLPVSIDEALLKSIAQRTDGNYFRAKNNQDLKAIYQEIDNLEASKPKFKSYLSFEEWYLPCTIAAFSLLLGEIFLRYTILRSFT